MLDIVWRSWCNQEHSNLWSVIWVLALALYWSTGSFWRFGSLPWPSSVPRQTANWQMKRLINKHADGLIGHLNTLRSATVPSALWARRWCQPSWQRTLYATHTVTGRTLTHPEQINNVDSSHALHTRSMWRKLTNLNIFHKEHKGYFGQVQFSYSIVYRSYGKSWPKLCLKGPYWALYPDDILQMNTNQF